MKVITKRALRVYIDGVYAGTVTPGLWFPPQGNAQDNWASFTPEMLRILASHIEAITPG